MKTPFLIPGTGWDTESIVSGYIKFESEKSIPAAKEAISAYPFDELYPFTNIFFADSPARYGAAVIGFAGSYKQIEEYWSEWLFKFADLLGRLDAIEAHVNLDCIIGSFRWKLEPKDRTLGMSSNWVIAGAPENDFSIDPEWLAHFAKNCERFVERSLRAPVGDNAL